MHRVTIYMLVDELPESVDDAELLAGLRARLEEFYVDIPGEDGHPLMGSVLGIDVEEEEEPVTYQPTIDAMKEVAP